jgi:hypothetical protein
VGISCAAYLPSCVWLPPSPSKNQVPVHKEVLFILFYLAYICIALIMRQILF